MMTTSVTHLVTEEQSGQSLHSSLVKWCLHVYNWQKRY